MKKNLILISSLLAFGLAGCSSSPADFNVFRTKKNASGDTHSIYFKGNNIGGVSGRNFAQASAGWWGVESCTFASDTVTIPSGSTAYFADSISVASGATYLVSYDLKTDGASSFTFNVNTPTWTNLQNKSSFDSAEYVHYAFLFTPASSDTNSSYYFAVTSGSISVQNLYISATTSISVTEGSAIGTLPDIPDVEGKVGHYEIDGTPIDATTVYNYSTDKYASLVYENDGKHNLYFALGQGNYAKSNAGWWDETGGAPATFDNGTVTISGTSDFSLASFESDTDYFVSCDLKVNGANGSSFHVYYGIYNGLNYNSIYNGTLTASDYTHYDFAFNTGYKSGSAYIQLQVSDGDSVTLKNLYVAKNSPLSVKEGEAIGTLPDMPSVTDKVGDHYEIDGTKIGADTVYNYTTDKFATSVYVDASYAWGKSFLSTTDGPCSNGGTESNYDKLSAVWGDLKTSYTALSDSEKDKVTGADVTGDGSLSRALARYDWIVNRYDELDDFMSRRNEGVSAVKGLLGQSNKTDGAAIAAASALSLAAVGTSIFLFAKKKKRD